MSKVKIIKYKAHSVDWDKAYQDWGFGDNETLSRARIDVSDQKNGEVFLDVQGLKEKIPTGWYLANTLRVKHYQNGAYIDGILLRYTKDGKENLGGEHVSYLVSDSRLETTGSRLLGMARMLKSYDGAKAIPLVTPTHALNEAVEFMRCLAPNLVKNTDVQLVGELAEQPGASVKVEAQEGASLGGATLFWIAPHIEKFEDGELITLMKVKMQLSDTLWAWCMVSSDGVEIFETNIHWDFDKMTRITAMHLHDLWRLKQDGC